MSSMQWRRIYQLEFVGNNLVSETLHFAKLETPASELSIRPALKSALVNSDVSG
jgi:hypothetical protein